MTAWTFDPNGPDASELRGPLPLARRGLGLPRSPGLYVITCGDCLAHVGTSGGLSGRVRTLAALGTHRGSAEVVCAAYCSGEPPQVWWRECATVADARQLEAAFKSHYGEPPVPRERYESCKDGRRLRRALTEAAGEGSWEAGYVEAVFDIGEKLALLFAPRFESVWARVGVPPGPWASR